MKISNYNLYTKAGHNQYILHNMITKETAILDKSEFNNFKNMRGDQNFSNELYNHGYYVDDENELLKIEENNKIACRDYSNLNITVIPTFACNLKCKYCYQHGFRQNLMSDENINALIEFIKKRLLTYKSNSFHISWFGGEPLLFFDKIINTNTKLLSFCRDNGVQFSSSISSNLTLIDDLKAEKLQEVGINRIETTMAGDEKTHNFLRSNESINSYQKTIDGIKIASKYFTIMINVNFCKLNFKAIKKFLIKGTEIKKDNIYLTFNEIVNYEQNRSYVKQYKNYDKKKFELYYIALKHNWRICDITNFCSESIYCPHYHKNSFAIDSNLNVYKCTEFFDENTRIGVIDKNDFECKFIDNFTDEYEFAPTCKICKFLPYCNGGCLVKRQHNNKPCPAEINAVYKYLKLFVIRAENS